MARSGNTTDNELAYLRQEVRRLRAELKGLAPDLETALQTRGFRIFKKEPADDLLIPSRSSLTGYYRMLHKYSFRIFLRDVIKYQQFLTLENVTRYATPDVTRAYLQYLHSLKLVKKRGSGFALGKGPIRSFGETLEWYIAEVFRREFNAESIWGVKFKRPNVGGDYDVIAKLGTSLLYAEVKSSPPKQIYDSEIDAFLDRVEDLSPEIALFLMDTELRMKDKIVPMFEKALRKKYRGKRVLTRMERELFVFRNRIFIINAREEIVQNIRKAVSWYYRKNTARASSV